MMTVGVVTVGLVAVGVVTVWAMTVGVMKVVGVESGQLSLVNCQHHPLS